MSRVYKFRAWKDGKIYDVQRLEWLDKGLKFYSEDGTEGICNESWRYYWSNEEKVWEDDSVLMQFTGLRDKNDNPIFEGDIVTQPKPFKNSDKVFWETGEVSLIGARYYIDDLDDDSEYGYYELDADKNCEVLGNVYDGVTVNGVHYKKKQKEA
jgi:uncharacterized phage protein (TIGR01671 family)